MTKPRVEEITPVERRRCWSREEKEGLVAASSPGATASEVARLAGIHMGQLFRWRKSLCERSDVSMPQLVAVEVAPTPMPASRETQSPTLQGLI
jgi:transposase